MRSDADSQDSITGYTLSSADSAKFSITMTGELTFTVTPDYESPGDVGSSTPASAAHDNDYVLVVTATSGTGERALTTAQELIITVTDVDEPPGMLAAPTVTAANATPKTLLDSSHQHRPGDNRLQGAVSGGRRNRFQEVAETFTVTSMQLTGLHSGTAYEVQVQASNAEGDSPWSSSGRATTAANIAPWISSGGGYLVPENRVAVGRVYAEEPDSADSITGFRLRGGDSEYFSITSSGTLTFKAAPDFEDPIDAAFDVPGRQDPERNNKYWFFIVAIGGSGERELESASLLSVIWVTDVDEPPASPAAPTVIEASHTSLNVSWTAPSNTGKPAITDYDVQYRKGTTGTFTDKPHTGTATTTTLTGFTPNTSYQVQVRATNAEGTGPWSDAGTDKTDYRPEDVNKDGEVDIDDLVAVGTHISGTTNSAHDADVNNDGDVDTDDIRLVARAALDAAATKAAPAYPRIQTPDALTAATLQDFIQQAKRRNQLDADYQNGIAVLETLLESLLIPEKTTLLPNYPNPFNPETWIPYQLASAAEVTLTLYDVTGRGVRTLALGHQPAGVYQHKSRAAHWDGRNAFGEPVASGIYFYTLTAGNFTATGKLLIRK